MASRKHKKGPCPCLRQTCLQACTPAGCLQLCASGSTVFLGTKHPVTREPGDVSLGTQPLRGQALGPRGRCVWPSFLPASWALSPTQQPCWGFVCIRQITSFRCPVHSLQWTRTITQEIEMRYRLLTLDTEAWGGCGLLPVPLQTGQADTPAAPEGFVLMDSVGPPRLGRRRARWCQPRSLPRRRVRGNPGQIPPCPHHPRLTCPPDVLLCRSRRPWWWLLHR